MARRTRSADQPLRAGVRAHRQSEGDERSAHFRKALHLLVFTEPRELCLGYTTLGVDGAGSGRGYAALIAREIQAAIDGGLVVLNHFEELGILE